MRERTDGGYVTLEAVIALAIAVMALSSFYQAAALVFKAGARTQQAEGALAIGLAKVREPHAIAGEQAGRLADGTSWTLHREATRKQGRCSEQPCWLVFNAKDAAGRDILELHMLAPAIP